MKQTNAIAIAICAAMIFSACGKEETKKEPPQAAKTPAKTPEKKAPAKPISQKELTGRLKALVAAVQAKDTKKIGEFYADDAVIDYADGKARGALKGSKAIIEGTEMWFKAFPDSKTEGVFIFMNGSNQSVIVRRSTGTQSGEFMGMPATNKKIGIMAAHHITTNPQGLIESERVYMDTMSFMGQLGMVPEGQFRPGVELSGNPPKLVSTADNDTEMKHLDTVKNMGLAVNARNAEKTAEYYADDATFSYLASPKDQKGKEAITKGMEEWFKMSTDVKTTTKWSWAAGNYVVAATNTTGTNDGEMPGGRPPTGKKLSLDELQIYELNGDKVQNHWIFADGMQMAKQLDLMPKRGEMPAGAEGEAGNEPVEK